MARVFMCPPEHFGVRYEINPWMSVRVAPDAPVAARQWRALIDAYRARGVEVDLVAPHPDLPDLVFTANAGLVCGERFIVSRFRHPERQREEPLFEAWARATGFRVVRPPRDLAFEGAGDALFCGDRLFLGHGWRTDERAARWLAATLERPVTALRLVDPRFYHLDTCFCPLAPGVAMAAPVAFAPESWSLLERTLETLIAVPESIATTFACNAMPVGKHLIGSGPAAEMARLLAPAGLTPVELSMSEFQKSGGAVRCLTLPLFGLGAQPANLDARTASALSVPAAAAS